MAGTGNDNVIAGVGNDRLIDDDGNDVLLGGEGDDLLDGGDGLETASFAFSATAVRAGLGTGQASGGASGEGSDT